MPLGLRRLFVGGSGSYFLYLCALGILIGSGSVGAQMVARHFVAFVEQSANDTPRTLSRVERHLQTVARTEFRQPAVRDDQIVALAKPAMPPVVLAAAIDRAERPDQPAAVHIARQPRVESWVKSASRGKRYKRKGSVLVASATKKYGKSTKAAKVTAVHVAQAANVASKPTAAVSVPKAATVQASAGKSSPPGKMALLPAVKPQKAVKPAVQLALAAPLPSETFSASPGEIVRVSLLGPP